MLTRKGFSKDTTELAMVNTPVAKAANEPTVCQMLQPRRRESDYASVTADKPHIHLWYDDMFRQFEQSNTLCRMGKPLLELHQATTWFARLRGLFAYPDLSDSEALLIQPCRAVHTVGLKYSIDVVFIDRCGTILKIARLKPGSFAFCRQACSVIEMTSGTALRLDVTVGQTLHIDATCRSGKGNA